MLIRSLIATLALAATGAAPAQSSQSSQSNPPAAPPKYESAFAGYQPYTDEKRANWRDVNDTAGVLGGHNAHLREIEKSVTGAGTVLEIDRANGWVRIDGDGVKPLGWPAGIAYWSLKAPVLAEQVKPGERIAFRLEKDGDVYRIAAFDRNAPPAPAKDAKEKAADPHAGHNMAAPRPASPPASSPAPRGAPPAAPPATKPPHDMKNMGGMK
jgi:Cu/Ag efflux protein CusF